MLQTRYYRLWAVCSNTYFEDYLGSRYNGGEGLTNQIGQLTLDCAKNLFTVDRANVQSHSGAQAKREIEKYIAVYINKAKNKITILLYNRVAGRLANLIEIVSSRTQ